MQHKQKLRRLKADDFVNHELNPNSGSNSSLKAVKNYQNWFLKFYEPLRSTSGCHPYELEAIGGDLYRFILGESRAAKSKVVLDVKEQYACIASKENEATFTLVRALVDKCENMTFEQQDDYINKYILTEERGWHEMILCMLNLGEGDATNKGNFGLNKYDEIARIDYNYTLFSVKRYFFDSGWSKFNTLEGVKASHYLSIVQKRLGALSEVARKRFYKAQLKTLLLGDLGLNIIISARHTQSSALCGSVNYLLKENIGSYRRVLAEDEDFIKYCQKVEQKEIQDELAHFFKFERNHNPELFEAITLVSQKWLSTIKYDPTLAFFSNLNQCDEISSNGSVSSMTPSLEDYIWQLKREVSNKAFWSKQGIRLFFFKKMPATVVKLQKIFAATNKEDCSKNDMLAIVKEAFLILKQANESNSLFRQKTTADFYREQQQKFERILSGL